MNDLFARAAALTAPASEIANSNPQRDYILLDASSSMITRWWESLTAIDSYVAGLKTQGVATQITLATFTGGDRNYDGDNGINYDIARHNATPQTFVPCLQEPPIFWQRMTPLYDGIAKMVRELRDLNPSRCAITIVTDGDDTSSQLTLEQAKSLLDWCRTRGWQITFLGCDWDNTELAKRLGCSEASAVGTSAKRLTDVTSELARKRAHHATHSTPMHFTAEERERFGGYLGR